MRKPAKANPVRGRRAKANEDKARNREASTGTAPRPGIDLQQLGQRLVRDIKITPDFHPGWPFSCSLG